MPFTDRTWPARTSVIVFAVIAAVAVYWRSAFPSISWWENSELTAAAGVLGIVHPPGALIPTLIGWLALRLPYAGSPAHWLNLVAGMVAGAVVLGVLFAARRLLGLHPASRTVPFSELGLMLVTALATMIFAFSRTFWANGTLFTPYIFTAVLTISLILTLLAWWKSVERPAAWRCTFLVMLLVGLDFSIHRTNLLLVPGIVLWALLRRPSIIRQLRHWAAAAAGLVLGLSVHLLLIPMARLAPPLNSNNPGTLGRLWGYISLKQYGGGFLVDLMPRKGDFWSVQIGDYVRGFKASFATVDGPLGGLGLIPLLLGVFGVVALWRHCTRLAISMLALFALTSLGAVIYFNLPANYFRAMDRHYLPSFVIFAVFITYGALALALIANRRRARVAVISVGVLVLLGGVAQVARNWRGLDKSQSYFAYDCGQSLMASLPQNSILITGTDVDTYPLWYLQMVEKQRPDVSVANVSLLNTSWYLEQMLTAEPALGVSMTPEEIAAHGFRAWSDSTVAIPTSGWSASAESFIPPDTLRMHVHPTVDGRYIFGHEDVVLRLIHANQWRRPLYFTSFALQQLGWLRPYLRPEGLVHRFMPIERPPADTALLIANLFTNYSARGYADPGIELEPPSRWVAQATFASFFTLAEAIPSGVRCEELKSQLLARMPLERMGAPEELIKGLASACVKSHSLSP